MAKEQVSPLIWFDNVGLGGSNVRNNLHWEMRTFGTLLNDNGHSEVQN